MLKENIETFEADGTLKFHRAGYLGRRSKGVTHGVPVITSDIVGNIVLPFPELYHSLSQAELVKLNVSTNQLNFHDNLAAKVFLEKAPETVLHILPINDSEFMRTKYAAYIRDNKLNVGFRSYTVPTSGYEKEYKKVSNFYKFFNSMGNHGIDKYNLATHDEHALGIGAVKFTRGSFQIKGYSSVADTVDFCSPTDIFVRSIVPGCNIEFGGTSASAPDIAGKAALVDDFFLDKTFRTLSMREFYNFARANSIDILEKGWDNQSGWGVFVLPEPDSIQPFDWFLSNERMTLTIGSETFKVDGIVKPIDASAIWNPAETRVLMPLRKPIEAIGGVVEWDEATLTATIYINNKTIKFTIGVSFMFIDGEKIPIDQAPIQDLKTWRTYIPVRAFAEAAGRKVAYDSTSLSVVVDKE